MEGLDLDDVNVDRKPPKPIEEEIDEKIEEDIEPEKSS
jgi:hypothetical protein